MAYLLKKRARLPKKENAYSKKDHTEEQKLNLEGLLNEKSERLGNNSPISLVILAQLVNTSAVSLRNFDRILYGPLAFSGFDY